MRDTVIARVLSALACLLASVACAGAEPVVSTRQDPAPVTLETSAEPVPTVCGEGAYDLALSVCWTEQVEPSQSIVIAIEMADSGPGLGTCEWAVGDISGELASGRLARGESTAVTLEVDRSDASPSGSKRLLYVYGEGDDGSTFAHIVDVGLVVSSATDPTPTLSCGYASFAVTTPLDVGIEYPEDVRVGIANEGILQCGDLDWRVAEPVPQAGVLSCSPDSGVLEGSPGYGQPATTQEIECTVDWRAVGAGQTKDLFLVLFSSPRVNGTDSAHLIRVRAARP